MAYLSGSQGSLWVDDENNGNNYDQPLAKVRNWSLSLSTQALETTSLQDTDRTYVPGLRTYTGSASFYYFPDAERSPGLSSLIRRTFQTRLPDTDGDPDTFLKTGQAERPKTVGFKLYMADNTSQADSPTAKGFYIQCRAVITELSIKVGVGEITSGDMSFQVVGAPQKVEA
jgi:hypothetical protein